MSRNSTKQDENLEQKSKAKTLARLFRYLFKYKGLIALVLVIMGISTGIAIVNPLIIERAINVHIIGKSTDGLVKLCILAAILNISLVVLIKVRMYLMAKMSNEIVLKIRQQLYEHIQTLGFGFFDGRPTGKILSRIMGDVTSLKNVLSNSVTTLIPDAITIIAVIAIMLIKDWRLGLASLWSLPIMMFGVSFLEKRSHKGWQNFRKKSSNLNAFLHEDIAGIRVIQSFHAEDETQKTFDKLTDEHCDAFVSACHWADLFGPVIDICWAAGLIAMYLIGIKAVGIENVSVGTLVAFGSYIGMFWQPVMNLSNYYNQMITNIAGAERIFEIFDTDPEICDSENAIELEDVKGEVDFKNVCFHYDDDPDVLHDVSFHVDAGETIALVGPTGAGKTTVVSLISRFYDVQSGQVLLDGNDLRDVSIDSLRSKLGVMTQDNFLFTGTIKENIRYGRLDATDEEIIEAAKAVNAHDFIMKMEKGYDTELSERGAGLSAGQRQLIAFARTMVSNPKILILDEATSSIDTHTEILVQQGIEKLLKGRTSFVIAHRLSTIQNADRIFVVDKGGIIESGTPRELIAKRGIYYDLYMAQFKEVS
ncbi:MAG: ABC transporter ATP-binding protein [Lachnospiraceae bacterium]|nr:ABC transporter ATP-binding protein [Lachnospiraceae bacterium]